MYQVNIAILHFVDIVLVLFSKDNLKLFPIDKIIMNRTFSIKQVYHHDGIAYDYYSQDDLGQPNTAYLWKIWPLPHEVSRSSSITME